MTVGFVDDHSAAVARVQNLRCKMFGISPADRRAVVAAVRAAVMRYAILRIRSLPQQVVDLRETSPGEFSI